MDEFVVQNMPLALAERQFPTVTLWNRLEGRPRTTTFDRALRAEVRDALWFLTRQWQTGEFNADDAGTPVLAKLSLSTTRLTRYQAHENPAGPFDNSVPLEAQVERRGLRFTEAGKAVSLDLRLLMGRQWIKLVSPIGNYASDFIRTYGIDPPNPLAKDDALYCAHREVWPTLAAVAKRRMDGAKLYFYLRNGSSRHAYDGIGVAENHKTRIDQAAGKFMQWFESLFLQPPLGQDDAWEADRLEYQFATSAPANQSETVFVAQEYYQGHLDWYNFDLDTTRATLGAPVTPPAAARGRETRTLIPVPVTFRGMPNTRWWSFEDGKTNFGDVKPDTTDLAKLLLIEFGLVYANDWSIVPFTLPMGCVARVEGLAVTNVFGERIWIDAAGSGADDWQRWALFGVGTQGQTNAPADTSLLLLPTTPKVQEGRPLEEVVLARDEMANMVWAVEKQIQLATGVGTSGSEAASELTAYYQRLLDRQLAASPPTTPPVESTAKIRYELMSTVPEHWIPFISVHVAGDIRQMQLQRAAMPRRLAGDSASHLDQVQPRTMLMREGLDHSQPRQYFIHEEEVPRAGIRLTQAFQRTRWLNGGVFVWLGVRKETGRGEGSSGLTFDRIVDVKPR